MHLFIQKAEEDFSTICELLLHVYVLSIRAENAPAHWLRKILMLRHACLTLAMHSTYLYTLTHWLRKKFMLRHACLTLTLHSANVNTRIGLETNSRCG
jgi:hypothetical protein